MFKKPFYIKKKIFPFVVFYFFMLANPIAHADSGFLLHHSAPDNIVGTIKEISRNTISIFDEQDKDIKKFVYLFHDLNRFHQGDRVRIYYRLPDYVIESMQKMTSVEYRKEGQNLGYLFKKE